MQPAGPLPSEGPTPTPDVPRSFVGPDPFGLIQGTGAAEDIFSTADNQTLIGGGGDDIFHVGTNTGLTLIETNPGTSTVETWSSRYALDDGIDNLTADGDYAHLLVGNAGNNVVTGAGGNDTLDGADGHNLLVGGGGADSFVFAGGQQTIADFKPAEGDTVAMNISVPHAGHIDDFADLQFFIGNGSIAMTTGADSSASRCRAGHPSPSTRPHHPRHHPIGGGGLHLLRLRTDGFPLDAAGSDARHPGCAGVARPGVPLSEGRTRNARFPPCAAVALGHRALDARGGGRALRSSIC